MEYSSDIHFIVFKEIISELSYAVAIADFKNIEKHYSNWDKFLYAPDDLLVEGIPVIIDRNNGMMNFEHENRVKLHVKNLVPRNLLVSK